MSALALEYTMAGFTYERDVVREPHLELCKKSPGR